MLGSKEQDNLNMNLAHASAHFIDTNHLKNTSTSNQGNVPAGFLCLLLLRRYYHRVLIQGHFNTRQRI